MKKVVILGSIVGMSAACGAGRNISSTADLPSAVNAASESQLKSPISLTCLLKTREGFPSHLLNITYTFADPMDKAAKIERSRWQKDRYSGEEYSSADAMYAVDGYPKVNAENDSIEILAQTEGGYQTWKFLITGYSKATPKVVAQFLYAGEEWLFDSPRAGVSCTKY
jgi:hypothetical protein